MDDADIIFRFQNRAEEIRILAGDIHDNVARGLLLKLASDYEHMVETLSRISATERAVRKRFSTLDS